MRGPGSIGDATELELAHAAERERQRLVARRDDLRQTQANIRARIEDLERLLEREDADVRRWDSETLRTRIYDLFADLEGRQEKERAERAAAALKLEEARAESERVEVEQVDTDRRLASVADAPAKLAAAVERREAWLRAHDSEAERELLALDRRRAESVTERHELEEAGAATVAAGEALLGLRAALTGASRLGTLDMVGGGLITSSWKMSRLNDVRKLLPATQVALDRMKRECVDVGISYELDPLSAPAGSGWLAEVLFDNVLTDFGTQLRTNAILSDIEAAGRKVEAVLAYVTKRRSELDSELQAMASERLRIVGQSAD